MTGTLNPPIPVIGQPNSIEDPVVKEALEKTRDGLNAILASDNTVDPALFNTANKIKFKWYEPKIIATEETRESASFGTLTTKDEISNVVVNENAIVAINYNALVKNSVEAAGRIAIFIGANQLKVPVINEAPKVQEVPGVTTSFHIVSTVLAGLIYQGGTSFVTTGESSSITSSDPGGFCFVRRLAAGTYNITIQYKSTSGTITAKERQLQVATLG